MSLINKTRQYIFKDCGCNTCVCYSKRTIKGDETHISIRVAIPSGDILERINDKD